MSAFETERLVARRPVADDEPLYRTLLFAPEVARWLRPPPLRPFVLADAALALDADVIAWERDGFGLAVLETPEGEYAGRGGMRRARLGGADEVELAWALLPRFWGSGLATEAARGAVGWAREHGLASVVAVTLPHNERSRAVMDRLGMTYERDVEHAGLPHVLYRFVL